MQCFVHILNLIAKSLLKQFDVKPKAGDTDDLNDDDASLLALAEDMETEELTAAQEKDDGDGEAEEDDQVDDWVDEVEALTPEERADLEESIQPVKRTLIKVGEGIPILLTLC
jgi:TATA-binding protein-associated factor Taf7